MSTRAEAYRYRKALKGIEGAWVRVFRDGEVWAGAHWHGTSTRAKMEEVMAALRAAGIECECRGKPGTSGEYIVNILAGEEVT